ncbi:MAG TPA: contractile injection system tape measure protein, partial [Chitinophagaceae bacterium]|nr:contractile injection system tape measure protein [Chitinophagaceae bacterium]
DLLSRPDLEKFMAILAGEKVKFISLLLADIQSIANFVTSEYSLQQRLVKFFTGMLIPGLTIEAAIQKWMDHVDTKYPGQILKVNTEKITRADIKMVVSRAQMTTHTTKDSAKEKAGIPREGLLQQESEKSISKEDFAQEQKDETLKAKKKRGSTATKSKDKVIADAEKKVIADVEKKVIAAVERNDTTPGDDEFRKTLQEGVYIDNAGAVIIAPFLRSLFSRVGLLTGNDINDVDKALLLLHYCVTGNTRPAEFELLFPKILCGISAENAITTDVLLREEQLAEADEMLLSVIEHWAVLKNTSVKGLREAFLQRNGKLTLINNEWRLQVEQKSYDMLLQQLPWNISMIKLPWMKNLLKTEWV